jgi:hypothetical protein
MAVLLIGLIEVCNPGYLSGQRFNGAFQANADSFTQAATLQWMDNQTHLRIRRANQQARGMSRLD